MSDQERPHLAALLARLGLPNDAAGPVASVPRRQIDADLGFVADEALSGPSTAYPIDCPAARELGLSLAWVATRRRLLEVTAAGGGAWRRDPAGELAGIAGEPAALRLDPSAWQEPFALVDDAAGVGLVLLPGRPDSEEIELAPLLLAHLAVSPAFALEEDLETWLASVDDPWLAERARGRWDVGDRWSRVVALGLLLRLERPPRDVLRARFEALLRGEEPPTLARARAFAEGLSDADRRGLEGLAVAAVEGLHEDLADVVREVKPDDPRWVADLRALQHARDDLEGVARLVGLSGGGERLRIALGALDEEAGEWTRALPLPAGSDLDERLARAAVDAPDGWWVAT